MGGKTVNKRELAEILDVSERTLTEWQRAGMPMVINAGRGHENQYNTSAVIQWLMERSAAGSARESQRERLERIRGDREELALSRDLEQLAPREDFEAVWIRHIESARAELLQISDALVTEIQAAYGIEVDADLIDRQVEGALSRLATHDDPEQPDDTPPDEDDGEAGAGDSAPPLGTAAEDDDKGMGGPLSLSLGQG